MTSKLDDNEIVNSLKPYLNRDVAILFAAVSKCVESGYQMPDKVLLMWGAEIDKARKLANVDLQSETAAKMVNTLANVYWNGLDVVEKFSHIKRAKEMLDRGQFDDE